MMSTRANLDFLFEEEDAPPSTAAPAKRKKPSRAIQRETVNLYPHDVPSLAAELGYCNATIIRRTRFETIGINRTGVTRITSRFSDLGKERLLKKLSRPNKGPKKMKALKAVS